MAKWFKHSTNSATGSEAYARLLDEQGVEGYGRYFLLIETLVRNADLTDRAPKVQFSKKRWAVVLHLKQKKVETFFEYLANLELIKLEQSENGITVVLCNYRDFLSDRAISSDLRGTNVGPKEEEMSFQELQLEANDEKSTVLDSINAINEGVQ